MCVFCNNNNRDVASTLACLEITALCWPVLFVCKIKTVLYILGLLQFFFERGIIAVGDGEQCPVPNFARYAGTAAEDKCPVGEQCHWAKWAF